MKSAVQTHERTDRRRAQLNDAVHNARTVSGLSDAERPVEIAQRKLQETANDSPRVTYLSGLSDILNPEPVTHGASPQQMTDSLGGQSFTQLKSVALTNTQSTVQRVKIADADYDNEEIWDYVQMQLEEQEIPSQYLPDLKKLFDELPEDDTYEYFDEIASELVDQLNLQKDVGLQFEVPLDVEELEEDQEPESGGWGHTIWKLMKIVTWLLFAQHVLSGLIPPVGATPIRRNQEPDFEEEGDFEQAGQLQLMLPEVEPEPEMLEFPQLIGSQVPTSPTRLDDPQGSPFTPMASMEQAGNSTALALPGSFPPPESLLSQMPPEDLMLMTPVSALNLTSDSVETYFPSIVEQPHFGLPRGGTRTDTGFDQAEDGTTLRDYIIWNIFSSRSNFGELPQIPRQDMTLMDWLVNGPSWLYLPYTKFSPTELAVFIKHFHIKPALSQIPKTIIKSMISTMYATAYRPMPGDHHLVRTFAKKGVLRGGYYSLKTYHRLFKEMQATNQEAREFRSDLSHNPWVKNSYRHSYWMCRYAEKWSPEFASDLGYAHEYAHLDLTIEGPFDSLIDKINNLWGVSLARNLSSSCGVLVNQTGEAGYLAWAKDYAVDEGSGWHLPTLHNIQVPLNQLWTMYQELPVFNSYDLGALRMLNITIPDQQTQESSVQIEEID